MLMNDSGGESGEIFEFQDLSPDFSVSKTPFVTVMGGILNRDTAKIMQPPGSFISSSKHLGSDDRRTLRPPTVGERTVLVVRVIALDTSTTVDEDTLSDRVFGTFGDRHNLKSQYEACSHNQLSFVPFSGATLGGSNVSNGVAEVEISENLRGMYNVVASNKATEALKAKYGSIDQFDHVMYCLPYGTSSSYWGLVEDWSALGYLDSWLSMYNDEWCTYLSVQMHNIGHNLYLRHANKDSRERGVALSQADRTGYMGLPFPKKIHPIMCFNNANNWQLGWFKPCHAELLDPFAGQTFLLVGAAEYSTATGCSANEAVVLMVDGRKFGENGYLLIGFNKKVGPNSETREGGNKVTVHRSTLIATDTYDPNPFESYLVAKLAEGMSTMVEGLVIKYCKGYGGKAYVGLRAKTDPCELCGNGVLDAGETCDDGNTVDDDGCSSACQLEVCGDREKQANEECDDGNTVSGDGCSSTCREE